MRSRFLFKSVLHIEYILFFIGLVCFCLSEAFLVIAHNRYAVLENDFAELETFCITEDFSQAPYETDAHSFQPVFERIKKSCIPLAYFAPDIDRELSNLTTTIPDFESSEKIKTHPLFGIVRLRNEVQEVWRRIGFGYRAMSMSSLTLILIAMAVIIYRFVMQKAATEKSLIISEAHSTFSRNLHDGLAQDIAAAKILLAEHETEKASFFINHALQETRYLIDSLHLTFTDDFETFIQKTLASFEVNCGIHTELVCTATSLSHLQPQTQLELLRIIQEALSNIFRHANATLIQVMLTDIADELRLVIKDNGRGFDVESLEKTSTSSEQKGSNGHWGIENMKKRVNVLGGTIKFINDGGLTIAISIKNTL
ncbi:MAG: ATP-binding protein [Treponema sp.]|nr:ATP-binding protein [Treponema sp.]